MKKRPSHFIREHLRDLRFHLFKLVGVVYPRWSPRWRVCWNCHRLIVAAYRDARVGNALSHHGMQIEFGVTRPFIRDCLVGLFP
jgi:hypothetical protein